MKPIRKYRFLFIFAAAFFLSAAAVSQTLTQTEPKGEIERAAREAVKYWKDQLSLSSKQAALMEKKIVEFAIKKNQLLLSKMRQEAKVKRLRQLQDLEHREMKDILTQLQYDRYLHLYRERVRELQADH